MVVKLLRKVFKVKNLERADQTAENSSLIAIEKRLNALKAVLGFLQLRTLSILNSMFLNLNLKYKKRIPTC